MTTYVRAMLAVGIACLSAPALAEDRAMPMGHAMTPAGKAFEASMHAMQHDMRVPMTGDTDRDFVAMMLPHHEGAVAMARVELQYGKDPALVAMAKDIVASQEKEITFMKAWQATHAK